MSAEIHDLGYRKYDGERLPVRSAVSSLVVHSVQRIFGLKRKFRFKVLPIFVLLVSFVPAIVFIGVAILLPVSLIGDDFLPTYGGYYGLILLALLLFCSFVAPELLCPDRRTGMLGLYLASPLTRDTYLAGKLIAAVLSLATMTILPPLLLMGGYAAEGVGPDGFAATVGTFFRIVGVGALLALFLASITFALSAVTPRKSVASAVTVITFLALLIVSASLIEEADAPDELALIDPLGVAFDVARRGLGEDPDTPVGLAVVSGRYVWLTFFAIMTACLAFTRTWYQRLEIER